MAFGNSYNDSSFTKGQQAAKAAPAPEGAYQQTQQAPQGAVQQSATPGQAPAAQEAPGFDLVDGIASVLFAPGRAIVGQFHPPTMKDLPLIIGLSAAFYWAAWWAYEKWVAPQFDGESDEKPTRVRIKRLKPRRVVVEDEDDAE